MNTFKFVFLVLTFIFVSSAYINAQDCKTEAGNKNKVIENKDAGCSEAPAGCCETSTPVKTAAKVKPWNEVCPVLGNKVNASVKTVEYNGKAYGFCCSGCDDKFAKDPEKYSKNLSKDGKKYNKS